MNDIFETVNNVYNFKDMTVTRKESGKKFELSYTNDHDDKKDRPGFRISQRDSWGNIRCLIDRVNDAYLNYLAEKELLGD